MTNKINIATQVVTNTVAVLTCVAVCTACTSTGGNHGRPNSAPPSSATRPIGVHVANRAAHPTETDAPGLKLPAGQLSFDLGNQTITVTADDWNTIVATSEVPALATVALDPYFHPNATSRNRFHYLADVIAQANGPNFGLYGVGSYAEQIDVVTLATWVNPADEPLRMISRTVTITAADATVESAGTFYTSAGHSIVIPAHGVSFARLTTPLLKHVPNPHQTKTSFTYKTVPCRSSSC
jgi:hypothetical protein